MTKPKIVLASQSLRRQGILMQLGLHFTLHAADIEESVREGETPKEMVTELARKKAAKVAHKHPDCIVIAGDTIVLAGEEIFGKPTNKAEAKEMLRTLSDLGTHQVATGFAVLDTKTEKTVTGWDVTDVTFRKLSEKEIEWYVETGEPFDHSGAYGLEAKGAIFVEKIKGDYYSVLGLPLLPLVNALKEFDIEVRQ